MKISQRAVIWEWLDLLCSAIRTIDLCPNPLLGPAARIFRSARICGLSFFKAKFHKSFLSRLATVCGRGFLVIANPPVRSGRYFQGGVPCASIVTTKTSPAFETTRKRRNSFPSETSVKRGRRFVHGDVELTEKLGRNDLCPCGSGHRFQGLLYELGPL
jgi:SEC-C motif